MKLEGPFNMPDMMSALKIISIIIVAIILIVVLSGCSQKQDTLEKIVYRDKECPTPKIKPIFKEYEMIVLEINGKEYYALQKSEAIKMSTNWISYKQWAEANYLLIKKEED